MKKLILMLVLISSPAFAGKQYTVNGRITDELELIEQKDCGWNHTRFVNLPTIFFIRSNTKIYWWKKYDLFIQYPGTSECKIWVRKK